jgi:hypothetical protein
MSATRGKRTTRGTPSGRPDGEEPDPGGRVPDLLRRVVGLGFSGFFLTEEVVRKTLGEKLPREWIEFAVEQSERTRRELIDPRPDSEAEPARAFRVTVDEDEP